MSPLRGVTFADLHMAWMAWNDIACVEKQEYFIGVDWDDAQRW
jgi:hypothetical protein